MSIYRHIVKDSAASGYDDLILVLMRKFSK
jgi:hypothetical protein